MRERNLFDELIQGVEEMRAQREAMRRNAVEDVRTTDIGTQEHVHIEEPPISVLTNILHDYLESTDDEAP
ncbi:MULTISPECIES: hypothetical protein [unclassified Pseudomonas]|uniref:hypothetical protein n=1 Tax=unclassified Pseudomonas TaxID=196821 RepID=UPI000D4429C2|nr:MULTISPECIES: hypothetical protein [unclassified Pseudomonas]PTR22701.1 hypothetical protein C8K63_109181 [Pseudomonas sp. GV085]